MAKAKKKATRKDAAPAEGATTTVAAPAATGKKGKRVKAPKAAETKAPPPVDLEALRKPVDEARTALAVAEAEANEMTEKARAMVAGAKDAYRKAVAPYREACRKAEVPCEFEGGRGANVSEKVSFEVERVEKGVRVAVKGKPGTSEVIPLAALKESINKAAYAFCEKHVGPREKVGNKGGSLSNRLRAVLR
ncbi:MAG: hypothetical protein HUU06_00340 [Planctomycetaceae bacterium]|nr:hypothetical protein [Planctomycetota bacterium]NUN51224.1 hypothetical protein [Planctomycetaceae bacterium]